MRDKKMTHITDYDKNKVKELYNENRSVGSICYGLGIQGFDVDEILGFKDEKNYNCSDHK